MDPTLFEKFKDHLVAFMAGVVASGAMVWIASENLHKKEVAILERAQADLQRRLTETEALLKLAKEQQVGVALDSESRKQLREVSELVNRTKN